MPESTPDLARLTQLAADTVGAAQRRLPPELRALARHVPVHYQALPAADVLADGFEPDILGLFHGSAHGTEFAHDNPAPPQIILYLENLWDFAEGDLDFFRDEVRLTYLHELGHYFGWDEDELTARGLD
jgi:predicted Zn-dependent protease with MMP-like domain